VAQQYLPDELADARYYRPGVNGAEGRLVARWRERRGDIPAPDPDAEQTGTR
jgi:replication-associated recombination protein RarA